MTDIDGRCFVKRNGALHPVDISADDLMASIPDGKEVILTIRQPRSPEFHRRFFAILRRVCDNSDRYRDEEELLACLKIACGHTKPVQLPNGEVYRLPRSINFANLGQDAFQRFTKRALYVLGQMMGIDPETLLKEATENQPPANKLTRKPKKHDADTNTAP